MAACALPMTFINSYIGFTVCMTLWGLGFGGFWLFMPAAMADVIDEVVAKNKKRDDGIYMGLRAFFGRLSYASQALVFWAIHTITKFDQNPESPQALFGIHLHMALIPAIFFLAGALVFSRLNTLTPAGIKNNKKILAELDL